MSKRDRDKIEIVRPSKDELDHLKDNHGPLTNYAEDHCLNTDKALRTVKTSSDVTAFCFGDKNEEIRGYIGYADGLICYWEQQNTQSRVAGKQMVSLLGHTNKINHLTFEKGYLFSSAQDCTVRQWNVDKNQVVRIYKFADPCTFSTVHTEHNLLFTGSWDKQVRAIDLKTGEVDRAFVASKDAIKCLHLYDKWLFVGGCDPVVRAYDLSNGNMK